MKLKLTRPKKKLRKRKIKKIKFEKIIECSICLEPILKGKHTLSCNHSFHTNCVINWFRTDHKSCPVCRKEPTVEDGMKKLFDNLRQYSNVREVQEFMTLEDPI